MIAPGRIVMTIAEPPPANTRPNDRSPPERRPTWTAQWRFAEDAKPPAAAAERHVAHPRWTPSPNEAPARSKTEATSEARAGAWTGAKPPQSIADRSWSPPIDGHGLFKSLMLRLPRGVRRSFDHEQLLAIRQAAEEMAWGEHPIDIRLRLPWPGGRRYLVLLGGRDQRGPAKRLQRHTRIHAVRVGNLASGLVLLSVGLTATLLLGLALRTLLLG